MFKSFFTRAKAWFCFKRHGKACFESDSLSINEEESSVYNDTVISNIDKLLNESTPDWGDFGFQSGFDDDLDSLREIYDEDDTVYEVESGEISQVCGEDESFLRTVNLSRRRKELAPIDFYKFGLKDVYEVMDYSLCVDELENEHRIPLVYKETECELLIDGDAIILVGETRVGTKVILKRKDRYLRCLDDPCRYPLNCVAVLDDENFSLFERIEKIEEKIQNIIVFSKLSAHQRSFVASMAKRPVIDERIGSKATADKFTPIRSEKELEMMYKLCRETYIPSLRNRVDGLFDQLKTAHGADRADLINQIAYSIGIDTTANKHAPKTFEEIMGILDKHFYGMKELKLALAEFIISMQLSGDPFCAMLLVGPPGVGKTSISNGVVECLEVPLVHIDCSGVDTITMSGLIKSYGGAKPGKVMDAFLEEGRTDVLMLLDEVDKMERTKGDPYGALIKPLGPQRKYYDEYIGGDTDVSATKFIATANDITKIPGYILSRFEGNIFTIDAYSAEEKVEITKNHVIPKKLSAYKLSADEIVFSDEALYTIAKEYCTDEGVRDMVGYITKLIRKAVTEWSRGISAKPLYIDPDYVKSRIVVDKQLTRQKNKMRIGIY